MAVEDNVYTAWDGKQYQGSPPDGWYQAADNQWWPEGYGPPPTSPEPAADVADVADVNEPGAVEPEVSYTAEPAFEADEPTIDLSDSAEEQAPASAEVSTAAAVGAAGVGFGGLGAAARALAGKSDLAEPSPEQAEFEPVVDTSIADAPDIDDLFIEDVVIEDVVIEDVVIEDVVIEDVVIEDVVIEDVVIEDVAAEAPDIDDLFVDDADPVTQNGSMADSIGLLPDAPSVGESVPMDRRTLDIPRVEAVDLIFSSPEATESQAEPLADRADALLSLDEASMPRPTPDPKPATGPAPVDEAPVAELPGDEPDLLELPVIEEPNVATPSFERSMIKEPGVEQPVYQQPVRGQPVRQQPVREQSAPEQPAVAASPFAQPAPSGPRIESPSPLLEHPEIGLGNNVPRRGKGRLLGVFGGLLLLAGACAVGYFVYSYLQDRNETSQTTEADGARSTSDADDVGAPVAGSAASPYAAGEPVRVWWPTGGEDQVWLVDPNDVVPEVATAIAAAPVEDGQAWVATRLVVLNEAGSDEAELQQLRAVAVAADGDRYESTTCPAGEGLPAGQVALGGQVAGNVCWLVDSADVPGLMVGMESTEVQGTIHVLLAN